MSGSPGARLERRDIERRKPHFFELVGKAVRAAREAASLSQAKLAGKCGLSLGTIVAIEAGRTCSLPALTIIAHEVDVSLNELVTMDASDALLGETKDQAAE